MLQLATREHCLLLRVGQMPLPLPPRLASLLSASTPLKVGRGIRNDAKMLRSQLGADVSGVVELAGRQGLWDLARSTASITGLTVPKETKWMTNWDARELSTESLTYAAFDSIASCAVHSAMQGGAAASPHRPPQVKRDVGTLSRRQSRRAQMRKAFLDD